jgi:hypothetical protein
MNLKVDQKQLVPIVAVSLLGLAILYGGYSYLSSMFQVRYDQITKLNADVRKAESEAKRVRKAEKLIRSHENRSLPRDPNVAGTAYQAWLVKTLDELGFGRPEIRSTRSSEVKSFLTKHRFTLVVEGEEMPKILGFLDRFHANDVLHRVVKLVLRPQPNSRKIQATIEIEALSLRGSKSDATLALIPSERYDTSSFPAVSDAILRRNLFELPNRAPSLEVASVINASRGKAVDVKWDAKEQDRFDTLNWELVDAGNTSAKVDPSKGTFSWTPDTNGDYTFVVKVTDNNYPPLSTEKTFKIVVTDPPPTPMPEPPKGYNVAKHAVLTAILNEGGRGEIWMYIRTSGEMLKLHEGDSFEVGATKGTVEKISNRDCTLNIDGTTKRLELNVPLSDARPAGAL